MSITYGRSCCCICLCKVTENLSSKDSDTSNSWIYKLRKCVSEIDWSEDYCICGSCRVQLDVVYDFYLLCIQSHQTRKKIHLKVVESQDLEIENSFYCDEVKYKNKITDECLSQIALKDNTTGTVKVNSEGLFCKPCRLSFDKQSEFSDHYKVMHIPEQCLDDSIDGVISNGDSESELDSSSKRLENVWGLREHTKDHNTNVKLATNVSCDSERSILGVDNTDLVAKENSQSANTRKKNLFTCEVCGSSFSYSTKLVKHMIKEHKMDKKDVKPFTCTQCPKRFDKNTLLLQHMKFHDGIRNAICPYCGKAFITKGELHIHEKTHLNKREYQCTLCPKRFNTSGDRNRHKLVVHTDPSFWKYVCTVCAKRLPSKSHYDTHMRRHNNDKPFACHLCEKKFCDKIVLQKHLRSHSNVRPYKCSECEKEYKHENTMQVHMARIHKTGNIKVPERVKKYICHLCPKSYYDKGKLTKHLYSHTGERPFACSICNKKFSDKSYVKHHMKTVHSFVASTDELSQ